MTKARRGDELANASTVRERIPSTLSGACSKQGFAFLGSLEGQARVPQVEEMGKGAPG